MESRVISTQFLNVCSTARTFTSSYREEHLQQIFYIYQRFPLHFTLFRTHNIRSERRVFHEVIHRSLQQSFLFKIVGRKFRNVCPRFLDVENNLIEMIE